MLLDTPMLMVMMVVLERAAFPTRGKRTPLAEASLSKVERPLRSTDIGRLLALDWLSRWLGLALRA
eukprot:11073194-Alexandrium_andersonii.AAC.1